jgi:hypothetical protein
MAALNRVITDCSPGPPANDIIWLMSQPEREGLPGGEAGPGAAAAGRLANVAGGLADKEGPPCQAGRIILRLDPENAHKVFVAASCQKKQRLNPFHAIYLINRLNRSNHY